LTTKEDMQLMFPCHPGNHLPFMNVDFSLSERGTHEANYEALLSSKDLESTLILPHNNNHNLTKDQKELLLWHYRLGHASFNWLQNLMTKPKLQFIDNEEPPVIPTKTHRAHNCPIPRCPACQMSKQHRCTTGSQHVKNRPECEMAICKGDLKPSDCVSMDQCMSQRPGQHANYKARGKSRVMYSGGTIFVDHASGFIHLCNQVSLRVGETLQSKNKFEQFAHQHGIKIKSYWADNHPFSVDELLDDILLEDQKITFSGVGAK